MATWAPAVPDVSKTRASRSGGVRDGVFAPLLVGVLTLFAVVVHGFHPYAEDGGLYLTGVKHLLDPSLFVTDRALVTASLRYSHFGAAMAGVVRLTHLPLDVVVLLCHVGSFAATLGAAWMLASRCFARRRERTGAVLLLACWMTLPVAGTSLLLMDPYVTARSMSTPAVLLLLVGTLDMSGFRRGDALPWRGMVYAAVGFGLAASFHPLMAAYGVCFAGVVFAFRDRGLPAEARPGRLLVSGLAAAAFLVAMLIERAAPAESAAYVEVALTRDYWFLSAWHWYEVVGLVAPLLLLGAAVRLSSDPRMRTLARAGLAAGVAAMAIAVSFARVNAPTHAVARLQPLRVFQLVYVVMILLLGGALGRWVLRAQPWRYGAAAVALAAPLFAAARATCPASPHLELGWAAGRLGAATNPWVEAFGWARMHTAPEAVFAMDPAYTAREGEDAQSFRAIAERSALPDAAKDGGEVAMFTPALADLWARAQRTQEQLSEATDAERIARLKQSGASYVILESRATTGFACEYDNGTVKLCRMPR